MKEVKENNEESIVFMLVGNKLDLVEERVVTYEQAFELKN